MDCIFISSYTIRPQHCIIRVH